MIESSANAIRWWPENAPKFQLDFGRNSQDQTNIEYGMDQDVLAIGDFRLGAGISTQQNMSTLSDPIRLHGTVNAGIRKAFNETVSADLRVKAGLNPFDTRQNFVGAQFALVPTHPTYGDPPDGPPPPLVPHVEVRRYVGSEINEARLGLTIIFANERARQ